MHHAEYNILHFDVLLFESFDQNVFVMDTAFKRRFEWAYISTKPVESDDGGFLNNVDVKMHSSSGVYNCKWVDLYQALNKFITHKEFLELGEDKQIGQFFIEFNNLNEAGIKSIIKNKLLHYLWNDVHKASFKREINLFKNDISSFSDLYDKFESDTQVFSEAFLNSL